MINEIDCRIDLLCFSFCDLMPFFFSKKKSYNVYDVNASLQTIYLILSTSKFKKNQTLPGKLVQENKPLSIFMEIILDRVELIFDFICFSLI